MRSELPVGHPEGFGSHRDMSQPHLKKHYLEQVVPALMKDQRYKNLHQVPKVSKVVLNTALLAGGFKNVTTRSGRIYVAILGFTFIP